MAILEEEVLITLHNKTINHYEKLGYKIPKYKDREGRIKIKRGTNLLVKINDLTDGSNVKLTKVCDYCGKKIPNQKYCLILLQRKDGKDTCYNCNKNKMWDNRYENIAYENSLEYYAIEYNKRYLLTEFSKKNNIKTSNIFKSSRSEYVWNCPNCKSEYLMSVTSRTDKNANCPYCVGQRVNNTNCLWKTHPEVAKLLKDPQRGYEISAGLRKKEEFVCKECGNQIIKNIADVVKNGFLCPKCSDGISYPEKFMFNVLEQLNINFETQKVFDWSESKRYDFYISSKNMIIETHGEQHYKKGFESFGKKTLEQEINNDKLKKKLALENKVKHYVIVDCMKSEINYIKNNIFSSELSNIVNLDIIDWNKCHEYACNSLVKTVCETWNERKRTTNEVAEMLNLSKSTIIRYLKQGVQLGWCDYDPKEEMRKSASENGKNTGIKIIQMNKNNEIIKVWNSIAEAGKTLHISLGNIRETCKGNRELAGGYKWIFKK